MGTSGSRGGSKSPSGGDWSAAKSRVTRFTNGGSGDLGGVLSGAVGAWRGTRSGGAGPLGQAAVSAGQRLGGLLSDVRQVGLENALRDRGLADAVGRPVLEVISRITDYVAGDGALLDEVVVRAAVLDVWADILTSEDEGYASFEAGIEGQVDGEGVARLMWLFIAEVVFQRFLVDLSERIDANAISASQADLIEARVHDLIREKVRFDLSGAHLFAADWTGQTGRVLIERNLELALTALEE